MLKTLRVLRRKVIKLENVLTCREEKHKKKKTVDLYGSLEQKIKFITAWFN